MPENEHTYRLRVPNTAGMIAPQQQTQTTFTIRSVGEIIVTVLPSKPGKTEDSRLSHFLSGKRRIFDFHARYLDELGTKRLPA